jgi:alkylated DNA nucleotide flippase Atl1
MSRVPIPYQRSAAIPRVYQYLKRAAAQGRYVTYKRLAMLVGLPISGNYMAREVGLLCGEISDWMDDQGLPMLSAIVVRGDTQMPGKGFVTLAVSLGRLHNGTSLHVKRRF